MNNQILKSENANPIRHNIIALGHLSPLLEIDFHQLAHCTDELETKTHWIKDADTNPTNLPDALLAGKIDYTWIFINEPEVLKSSVLNAILQSSKVSPIFIVCYSKEVIDDAEPVCKLDEYTRSITGPYKIHFSLYLTDPFRSLHKHRGIHWIDQLDVETPIFHGEEARANDPLYPKARAIVLKHRRASISIVQRLLRIGYNHSARLLDAMVGDILTKENVDGRYNFIE